LFITSAVCGVEKVVVVNTGAHLHMTLVGFGIDEGFRTVPALEASLVTQR
jgi:hypothetical protein